MAILHRKGEIQHQGERQGKQNHLKRKKEKVPGDCCFLLVWLLLWLLIFSLLENKPGALKNNG